MAGLRQAMADHDDLTLIDVQPATEYRAAHAPGAVMVPEADLAQRMADLPRDTRIVAYCRGPYCVMAATAAQTTAGGRLPRRPTRGELPDWLVAQADQSVDA